MCVDGVSTASLGVAAGRFRGLCSRKERSLYAWPFSRHIVGWRSSSSTAIGGFTISPSPNTIGNINHSYHTRILIHSGSKLLLQAVDTCLVFGPLLLE